MVGMEKPILTIAQAAKLLQVDPNTIYRWARAGKFPASKIGKEWRVLHSDVIKFIQSKKNRNQLLTDSQEAELLTALVGRREIPLKFEYLGEGADRYVSIFAPQVGGGSEEEIIFANKEKFIHHFEKKRFSLLDIGCGDGKKAAYFISHITKDISAYSALDISSRIIEIAETTMNIAHPNLSVERFIDDFEYGNVAHTTYYLHRRYQQNNLILFIGNTIGNTPDSHRVLINLRDSMGDDDQMLVGLAYHNPKNIPLEAYNQKTVTDWLWTIPERLGINREFGENECIYNKALHQFEFYLSFTKNWERMYRADLLRFAKGQKIRLAISRRFTKDDIFELFAGAGFKIELLVHDKDNALVLVRPHSWEKKV